MKRWLFGLGIVVVLLGLLTVGFLFFGPTVTDKRQMLNQLLGRRVQPQPEQTIQRLHVPVGFALQLYASDLGGARFMRVTPRGDLLVSQPRLGIVVLLERDANGDGRPDGRRTLLSNLDRPHGLDVYENWLYVGESTAIGRVPFDADHAQLAGEYQHIVTGLTGNGNHWTKTVRIGPDGYLYVAQGSTCNVCVEEDQRRATVMRFNADGSDGRLYATGLRNSVGMDWAPWDQALYATENGRDLLGDDFPPDEINRIVDGGFYGWPYINGNGVLDPDMGKGKEAFLKTSLNPAYAFGAHNAPLGMTFLRHGAPGYERAALVALHGSWNRSTAAGYKVVSLQWQDGSIVEKDFLTGFHTADGASGRPVDVIEDAHGVIYISDDYAGAIYRVMRR